MSALTNGCGRRASTKPARWPKPPSKTARALKPGDRLHIDKHGAQIYDITVAKCEAKRVAAPVAQTYYQETADSIARRSELQAQQRAARDLVQYPERRPDKRDRRQIRAFRHGE